MGDPQIRHWNIGDVKITRIVEMTDPIDWSAVFAEGSSEYFKRYDWLTPHFTTPDGQILLVVQAFVVTSGTRRIIVDTCVGNDKSRRIKTCDKLQTSFLGDLTAAGYPPETIDTVLCTHLHFDHVGWNTRLVDGRWVPTFPNARYLFGRREWEHAQNLLRDKPVEQVAHLVDSVQPVLEAGLADFVEPDHRVTDEVWLEPTPGHTPGHVSVHIASGDRHAVITGDVFYNPIQFAEPDLRTKSCADPDMSGRTRRAFLTRYENKQALVIGSHFCDPTAGWIVRDKRNWRFSTE
jgi:glyoxylase-like metal-dependent hydrolase (beta-lactamase superfamily II)